LETEVENLYRIDVGLMPLKDDLRSKGKGGFKLLQYMGLGIVSVASGITINNEIVDHGENAFLANSVEEWKEILVNILEKRVNFVEVGARAKEKITKGYTFMANTEKFLNFVTCKIE
ncbi:MAG: glycosyltransferase, partial [Salinivirgaceae bacterium]|nr:glycosyltransferase [Salinivirgaceae bacterium]